MQSTLHDAGSSSFLISGILQNFDGKRHRLLIAYFQRNISAKYNIKLQRRLYAGVNLALIIVVIGFILARTHWTSSVVV